MPTTDGENEDGIVADGIVRGTEVADQIDENYTGDPDGDRVDDGVAYSPTVDDWVLGGEGDDSIDSGDGDDLVHGEGGNDTISSGEGNDHAQGGDGDDVIHLGEGDDRGSGNAGNDQIYGQGGDDFLTGGDGNDKLHGGTGHDILLGGAGNDVLCGGDGPDQLYGGEGDDCVVGGKGDDVLLGDAGNDGLFGGQGNDQILGGEGNDVLVGGEGDDLLVGGDGDDVIFGGAGNDFMKGFHGSDTFKVGVHEDGPSHDIVNGGAKQTFETGLPGASNASGIDKLYLEGPVSVTLFDNDGNFVRSVDLAAGDEEDLQAQGLDDGIATLSDGSTVKFTNIEQICVVEEVTEPEDCDDCICFTSGTQIATIGGLVAVDTLKVGDKIITRDNGYQEIRWIGRKKVSAGVLAMQPHLKPVLIRAGALGPDLPERDMMVSPQHRMLLTNAELMLHFGETEVLVPAKHLIDGKGVSQANAQGIEYIHVLFDHHEVILADGAWSESFQPGDYSLSTLDQEARAELRELFPELENAEGQVAYAASRPTLKAREAEMRSAMRA